VKTFVSLILQTPVQQYARFALICCLSILPAHGLNAGITACKLADGSVVFQDTACIVTPEHRADKKPTNRPIPLGIEKTWFDQPSVVPHLVACSSLGCDCGEYFREFKNGLPIAVADALYLDGSWHRLEATLAQLELTSKGSLEYHELADERDEAACNILMSQKTLRMFGQKAVDMLRTRKRYAEDMGWDNPNDCDAGLPNRCDHSDNIALYHRILSDSKALGRTARIGNDAPEDSEIRTSEQVGIEMQSQPETTRRAQVAVEPKRDVPAVSAANSPDHNTNTFGLPFDF